MTTEMIISDMTVCEPSSAMSRDQIDDKWYMVDYETDDGVEGTMIYADTRSEVPQVKMPVDLDGWYKIYVGINYTRVPGDGPKAGIRIKLSEDKDFTVFGPEQIFRHAAGHYPDKMGTEKVMWNSVYEVYWKSAQISKGSLCIAPNRNARGDQWGISNLSWVRFVEMSDDEIDNHKIDFPTETTKRLAAEYCQGDVTGATNGNDMYHPTDEGFITEKIEPFRDTDFNLLLWECIRGDMCAFNSKIGRVSSNGNTWDPEWIDPLEVAVDYAHDCGMEIYVSMRMVGSGYPFKLSPIQQNQYYYDNREYTLKDEAGRKSSVLSVAYPNIREHWVALLREAVEYGADGVHLCFNRSAPFVLYEEPVRDTFIEIYGEDPVDLDYEDERWLRHRSGFVTEFLRDIRKMLDQQSADLGKRLGLAVTFYHKPYPLYNAMDLKTWIDENLVDYLIPHWVHIAQDDGAEIVSQFTKLTEDTNVKLLPDIYPRTPPGEKYAEAAKLMYDAGADGFAFWSAEMRTTRASEWAVVRRLGHKEELNRYVREAPRFWRSVNLKELDGVITRYSHNDG
ncbi:MAG: family 10 glycosylhydrolase [Chloroflexota bacterium]|nr:family 10 glycosylhydrolase [Chloroflexota bacterium]